MAVGASPLDAGSKAEEDVSMTVGVRYKKRQEHRCQSSEHTQTDVPKDCCRAGRDVRVKQATAATAATAKKTYLGTGSTKRHRPWEGQRRVEGKAGGRGLSLSRREQLGEEQQRRQCVRAARCGLRVREGDGCNIRGKDEGDEVKKGKRGAKGYKK